MDEKIQGKLILTSYKTGKAQVHKVACFIANDKLEYVKVIPQEDSFPIDTILTGKVTNVVANIPAAFVALNADKKMGFLSLHDTEQAVVVNRKYNGKLQSGDEVLVKVVREPIKTKDAALTTVLDMSGRYAAAQLGSGKLLFSKKLSPKVKDTILQYLVSRAVVTREKQLIGMEHMNITIRTQAETLLDDLSVLVQDIENTAAALQNMIKQASMRTCYYVHQKPVGWMDEVWKELASIGFSIEEYITDDFYLFSVLQNLVPKQDFSKLRFYKDDRISLSVLYSIQSRLEELTHTNVWLPCGGYLCIEPTEAMVVIDVNSGKAIQKKDAQTLFAEVNKEAAYEIARQLRLRNLSGMIIIDFINMSDKHMEEAIIDCMKQYVKHDYCKTTVYEFTRLGLLELTRSKKSKALHEIL